MTGRMGIFLSLLLLNLIITVVYLVWNLLRKKKNCIMNAIVMFLCPLVGPCFFLLAYLLYKLFFSEPVDLEDVIFSKERVETHVHAQEEQERNMVSLEEAIEVTNEKELRTLMMNIVRGDIQKFLATISLALNSEDTETAHYAASVLQDALNDFRIKVEQQYRMIKSGDEYQLIYAETLLEYMNQVLAQKVFTDLEQCNYVGMMDEVCELYYNNCPEQMTSARFEAISMRLLEIKDFDNCTKWCERAKSSYPNALATYSCQLKLYFTSGQRQKFFEVIEELKQSSVVVDRETLELLRVFR